MIPASFTNSRTVEQSFTRDRQWQSAGRRDHVYGRPLPMNAKLGKSFSLYKVMGIGVMTACTIYAASLWAMPDGPRFRPSDRASSTVSTATPLQSLSQKEAHRGDETKDR